MISCTRKLKYLLGIPVILGMILFVNQHQQDDTLQTPMFVATASRKLPSNTDKIQVRTSEYGTNASEHTEHRTTSERRVASSGRGSPAVKWPRVAIGVAVTSVGMGPINNNDPFKKVMFFHVLLKSFCSTASKGFDYHLYVAYDNTDQFFITRQEDLQRHYRGYLYRECAGISLHRSIHFLECGYSARPAWSQNDAMMQAYLDGSDYFYRVNDDSRMESSNWTEAFIQLLRSRHPPNVGVVGPHHHGGNTKILTHDFVHKTHVEIFGLYYPRCYSDLFADTWISNVYPDGYKSKLRDVLLAHTRGRGKRYRTRIKGLSKRVSRLTNADKPIFSRYLKYKTASTGVPVLDGTKVIAMSLYGDQARHTLGVIRNAQLAPIMFPGWRLRVYTAAAAPVGGDRNHQSSLVTPQRIIDRLEELGAEISYIDSATAASISAAHWSYLVVDDDTVKYFIVRNADGRLSQRDFAAVYDWVAQGASFHFMLDHEHMKYDRVSEGFWGGTAKLKKVLPSTMKDLLRANDGTRKSKKRVLDTVLHSVKSDFLVHDGISCKTNQPNCRTFTVKQKYRVDQLFDEFHTPLNRSLPVK